MKLHNKMKSAIVCGITLIAFSICMITTFAFDDPMYDLNQKYSEMDLDKAVAYMETMSYNDIGEEAKYIASVSNNYNDLFVHIAALYDRVDEIPELWFVSEIGNKDNPDSYRYALIELSMAKNNGEGLNNLNLFKRILTDETEESNVRCNAAFALMDDPASLKTIMTTVFDNDENVAFQSLKIVNMVDPEIAIELSDHIINNNIDDIRFEMAIKVKAQEYQKNPNDKVAINNFISLCKDFYDSADNEVEKFTAIFALSDLYQEEALRVIVNEPTIDEGIKRSCVGQNYLLLKDLLQNPSVSDVEFVVDCCEIVAIDEVVESLDDAVKALNMEHLVDINSFKQVYPANEAFAESYLLVRS